MKYSEVLYQLYDVIMDRQKNPKEGSYTNYLLEQGLDKVLKKIGEETAETIIAAKNTDKNEVVSELSDLLYHISVLLAQKELTWDTVFEELARRELKEGNLKNFHTKGEI
jgi:phosphoribosyl-ATP pyrophosphohydrolase